MKKNLLFLKMLVVTALLFVGVSARAITNNVELIGNSDFSNAALFTDGPTSFASTATTGKWYAGGTDIANYNTTGFQNSIISGSFDAIIPTDASAAYNNFVGQVTTELLNTGRYRISVRAKGTAPLYLKISSTNAMGTELTFALKNASSSAIQKQSTPDYTGYSLKITPTETWTTYSADLDIQNPTASTVRMFFVFPKAGNVSVDDISMKRTADIPSLTTFYVRPTGNTTAWTSTAGVDADQIVTTTSLNGLNAANTYYFATGNYTMSVILSLTSGAKWYGGFSGNEASIDLNARATNDKDGNGLVEPWELSNEVVVTGSQSYTGAAGSPRLLSLTGAEVNGLTFQDYNYSQSSGNGAIVLGYLTSSPTDAQNISGNAGVMKYCTIRKIKTTVGSGVIMMTNSASLVDNCLIEDCRVIAGNGTIYMNRHGGTVSNSVLRNNIASGHGGAIYSGNTGTATGYTGTVQTAFAAIVKNCAVYNNTGGTSTNTGGGAIRGDATSATTKGLEIINCTVVNNTTSTAGTSSVELISSGVLANSIVLSDTKSEIRPNSTTNYILSTVYGANGGTTIYPGTNNFSGVSDLTFTAINFKTPTTFNGAVGNSTSDVATYTDAQKNEIKAANYTITSATSKAVTTTSATLPGTFKAAGGTGADIAIMGSVPTTDITGATRQGSSMIGAYDSNIWSGATSTDWATGTNWSKGASPLNDVNVEIPNVTNKPIIASTTSAACKNLNVLSGSSLTILSDASNSGQLQITGTATGNVTYNRYMTPAKWHIISSPVSGLSVQNFITNNTTKISTSTSGGLRGMTDYNSSTNTWNNFFTTGSADVMSKGYMLRLRLTSDGLVSFTGVPRTGTISQDVVENWNCIGNPFTSAITPASIITANDAQFSDPNSDGLFKVIYLWDNSGSGQYLPATGSIQAGQAFMVRMKSGATGFAISKADQSANSSTAFRSAAATDWTDIKLNASNGTDSYFTEVKFNDAMSKGADVGYDAGLLRANKDFSIYTRLLDGNTTDICLQALPTTSDAIPVGLDHTAGGNVTFTASSFPEGYNVMLEDRAAKTFIDLSSATASYTANVPANTSGTGRFFLYANPNKITTGVTGSSKASTLVAYLSNGNLYIRGEVSSNAVATIYDVTGKAIQKAKLNAGNSNIIPFTAGAGIYVVKVDGKQLKIKN